MKLYQTRNEEFTVESRWSGTQADASKDRATMKKDGRKNIQTREQEVPTNKTGLLEWLNTNKVVI